MEFLKIKPLSRWLLIANIALALVYFVVICFFFPVGNVYLFALLIIAEIFHLWQVLGYIHSVWPRKLQRIFDKGFSKQVGVFITVCGEPADIIEETILAAKAMDYPAFNIYILNDGLVAQRDNWREAETLATKHAVTCITRQKPGGAKAGNINNALRATKEPFVLILDADHIPKPHLLKRMMGYFGDDRVGFVQSPQYYKNHDLNIVTGGAWEQQALFFGAICKGKDGTNSTFMCGTNMVLRRIMLDQVGGMAEESIAEDFLTSLFVHSKQWRSVYVDEVLAEGLSPEDFLSYYKQQFRWARGSLEVALKHNVIFRKGLSISQRVQYLSSSSFYLSGVIVALNAILPIIFFFTGLKPLEIGTMTLALVFLPYIFLILYTIQLTSNFSYTFRALCFTIGSFPIHLQALWQIIIGKSSGFVVTSKSKLSGSYGYLVTPHLVYIGLVLIGAVVAFIREGLSASLLSNLAWAIIYIAIFVPFIMAAYSKDDPAEVQLAPHRMQHEK